jgi:hypothetical protein
MKLNLIPLIIISLVFNTVSVRADQPLDPGQAGPAADDNVLEKAIDDALSVEKAPAKFRTATPQQAVAAVNPTPSASPAAGLQATDTSKPAPKLRQKPAKMMRMAEDKPKVEMVDKKAAPKSHKITKEEADYLKKVDGAGTPSEQELAANKNKSPAYVPAPVEAQEVKHEGFLVERDSSKVIRKRMSFLDALNVKVCYSAGLSIILDEDIQTELQRVIIDDKIFFDAIDFDNHRGVFVKLKQPIPEGKYWESSVRLVRKDNDKTYLVNLLGVPCPKSGVSPYPKTVYLKDKFPGISGKNSKLNTPEDTIIDMSDGLPRKNENKINVYDMIARSTSDWTIFGIQIQFPVDKLITPEKLLTIKVLDNLQMNELPARVEYIKVPSEKATESLGVPTARFKAVVNIDKQYFTEQRYLYFMFVDKDGGYYQYIRVDTLPYVLSLKERGFDI